MNSLCENCTECSTSRLQLRNGKYLMQCSVCAYICVFVCVCVCLRDCVGSSVCVPNTRSMRVRSRVYATSTLQCKICKFNALSYYKSLLKSLNRLMDRYSICTEHYINSTYRNRIMCIGFSQTRLD